jgi:hypothetical protein
VTNPRAFVLVSRKGGVAGAMNHGHGPSVRQWWLPDKR